MPRCMGPKSIEVLTALDDVGPMGAHELTLLLDRERLSINASLRALRDRKLIRIMRWDSQPDGNQGNKVPIYALGDAPDAPKPKPLGAIERNKRYRKRHAAAISVRRYGNGRNKAGMWSGLL